MCDEHGRAELVVLRLEGTAPGSILKAHVTRHGKKGAGSEKVGVGKISL